MDEARERESKKALDDEVRAARARGEEPDPDGYDARLDAIEDEVQRRQTTTSG